jgi:hypothetical protein
MAGIADIRTYLTTEGLVEGATGWTCTLGTEPSSPDKCVTIYEYPGFAPARAFGASSTDVPRPSYQIRVRGESQDYLTPNTKIKAIVAAINKATISGDLVLFAASSAPTSLGMDENNRHRFVYNFDSYNFGGF